MNILEISKSSSAKTEFSFFFGIFSSVSFFSVFFQDRRRCRFRFFKISRYRFRFSVTESALAYLSVGGFSGMYRGTIDIIVSGHLPPPQFLPPITTNDKSAILSSVNITLNVL